MLLDTDITITILKMKTISILLLEVCFSISDNNLSDPVLGQYTEYPYPEFNQIHMDAERRHYENVNRKGPYVVIPDLTLENLNHYLYHGEEGFRKSFRVLIAGGGIGGTAMFLAEQLNHTNAEIVYLDFSPASMKIAQERAAIRNLRNIIFINDRIENIPNLNLGLFDLIDSYGVLHHLKHPQEALEILGNCLKEKGGMTIMMYAQYGRTGVYNMQTLQQLVNEEAKSRKEEVSNAWKILDILLPTNLFKRTENLAPDHLKAGDAGLYDLLLHKQDQAYTMPDMMEMINMSGLHFVAFAEPAARLSMNYNWYLRDIHLLETLGALPLIDQLAIGELISGNVLKHTFYISKEKQEDEPLDDLDKKLCFMGKPETLNKFLKDKENRLGTRTKLVNIDFLDFIQSHHYCTRSIKQMFSKIKSKSRTAKSAETLLSELKSFYNFGIEIGQLLVRKKEIGPSPLSVQFRELFDRFYALY